MDHVKRSSKLRTLFLSRTSPEEQQGRGREGGREGGSEGAREPAN